MSGNFASQSLQIKEVFHKQRPHMLAVGNRGHLVGAKVSTLVTTHQTLAGLRLAQIVWRSWTDTKA